MELYPSSKSSVWYCLAGKDRHASKGRGDTSPDTLEKKKVRSEIT